MTMPAAPPGQPAFQTAANSRVEIESEPVVDARGAVMPIPRRRGVLDLYSELSVEVGHRRHVPHDEVDLVESGAVRHPGLLPAQGK